MAESTIQCAWRGDKFLSEVVVKTPIAGSPRPRDAAAAAEWDSLEKRGKDLKPQSFRALYDGNRYFIYWPSAMGSGGYLTIMATMAQVQDMLYAEHADQRPHTQWLCHPRGHSWTLLTQFDDRKNKRVKRWDISLDGNLVKMKRFVQWEKNGKWLEGSHTLDMNLELNGAVVMHTVSATGGGKIGPEKQRVKASFVWEKINDLAVMRKYEFVEEIHDVTTRKTYEIRNLSLSERRADEFVEAALRVRPGARVDDKSQGKSYNYGGKPVSQADLDRVIKEAKAKPR